MIRQTMVGPVAVLMLLAGAAALPALAGEDAKAQAPAAPQAAAPRAAATQEVRLPGLASTEWLAANVGKEGVKVLDLRDQREYNTGHVPGALRLAPDSLRGTIGGVPSMLLPPRMLAGHFSLLGFRPTDTIVLVAGEKMHDATLAAVACERLGHLRYAVLDGGFLKWSAEKRPADTALPRVEPSEYPVPAEPPDFIITLPQVVEAMKKRSATIIDARPPEYYSGKKSEEARGGHIPGAASCFVGDDLVRRDGYRVFRPVEELAARYATVIPSKDAPVIDHCRTGHEASQTFFVLRRLLGYENVKYFDGGWTEWSPRADLPAEK